MQEVGVELDVSGTTQLNVRIKNCFEQWSNGAGIDLSLQLQSVLDVHHQWYSNLLRSTSDSRSSQRLLPRPDSLCYPRRAHLRLQHARHEQQVA